jgi:hypothetical protein
LYCFVVVPTAIRYFGFTPFLFFVENNSSRFLHLPACLSSFQYFFSVILRTEGGFWIDLSGLHLLVRGPLPRSPTAFSLSVFISGHRRALLFRSTLELSETICSLLSPFFLIHTALTFEKGYGYGQCCCSMSFIGYLSKRYATFFENKIPKVGIFLIN